MTNRLTTLSVFTVFVGVLASPSCSPPRPHENTSLATNSTSSGGNMPSPSDGDGDGDGDGLSGSLGGSKATDPQQSRCTPLPKRPASFSKKALLESAGRCAMLRYCEFQEAADTLAERARSYAKRPDAKELAQLRETYHSTIESFARTELFQFGPAASAADDPVGGQGLRDLIYAWPFVSRCRVEEQLFGGAYRDAGFDNLVKVPINSRGLFAVEYLSFYEGNDNDCTQFSITNAGNAWGTTEVSQLNSLKRDYLEAVASDVAARAKQLTEAWSPAGGDYLDRLINATGYMDQQHALNLVAHSLLYVEVEVKDYKVGTPAGLYEMGPSLAEGSFSNDTVELLRQNVEGFADLFAGCGGTSLGFDDWLIAAGHEALADDMNQALAGIQNHLKDFSTLSGASNAELVALHTELRELTQLLKTEFFGQGSPLGLGLPTSVEGDTD